MFSLFSFWNSSMFCYDDESKRYDYETLLLCVVQGYPNNFKTKSLLICRTELFLQTFLWQRQLSNKVWHPIFRFAGPQLVHESFQFFMIQCALVRQLVTSLYNVHEYGRWHGLFLNLNYRHRYYFFNSNRFKKKSNSIRKHAPWKAHPHFNLTWRKLVIVISNLIVRINLLNMNFHCTRFPTWRTISETSSILIT